MCIRDSFYTPLPAPHDIAEANRLLDEAGYPRGKDGKRFSIIVDYSPDSPLPRELLRLLQYELAARLGIEVRTRDSESVSDWMRHVVTGDYQVVLDELFAWYDPVIGIHRLYSKNNSDRGIVWTNSGGYANDTVEALMQQATEDVYKRQTVHSVLWVGDGLFPNHLRIVGTLIVYYPNCMLEVLQEGNIGKLRHCLLYTSPVRGLRSRSRARAFRPHARWRPRKDKRCP